MSIAESIVLGVLLVILAASWAVGLVQLAWLWVTSLPDPRDDEFDDDDSIGCG